MDTQKIGRFLSTLRKEKGLTQEQLAEKIGSTYKTISRWETGCYLPPVEMLLELSNFYQVSLNEILSGERISSNEDYRQKAEENIQETLKTSVFTQKEVRRYLRNKWLKDHLFELIIYPVLLSITFACGVVFEKHWLCYLSIIAALIVIIIERNFYLGYIEKHLYN